MNGSQCCNTLLRKNDLTSNNGLESHQYKNGLLDGVNKNIWNTSVLQKVYLHSPVGIFIWECGRTTVPSTSLV
jgi:hypothetical protein